MRRGEHHDPEYAKLLASASWSACEQQIKAFESAWRQQGPPNLVDYLIGEGLLRRALLVELLHVDLEFRIKANQSARVEDYLADHPDLRADRPALLGLLAAEYRLRCRVDGSVGVAEYAARFPSYLDELFDCLLGEAEATRLDRGTPRIAARFQTLVGPAVPGFEILRELGRGGMGVVYHARDARLGRSVALKFLPHEYARDPDRLERFLREARTASALNHPHICTVHGLGEHQGQPFIILEFIDGRTLRELVGERLGVESLAQLIGQAARALAVAHRHGIVHRDIKPENIMVRDDGYVKVLDFGLARPPVSLLDPQNAQGTTPGAFLGTVAYSSPEQAQGAQAVAASDVFSLGVVLYQLATGHHPFEAPTSREMLQAIQSGSHAPASALRPDLPASLAALIEAMLRKSPVDRPTMDEVESALTALTGRGADWPVRAVPSASPQSTVGRDAERTALRVALADAAAGRGAILCISGEPGIGKTTLVEGFLRELTTPGRAGLTARGRCSERLAGAEAYLPVLEALEDLLRSENGSFVARLMKVLAPAWYAQVAPADRHALSPAAAHAASQHAMQREFCRFVQEAGRQLPMVLFFDDVHWADISTVDLLGHLGRQLRGLRVLVLVTCRPSELQQGPHPFLRVKLDLQTAGVCRELPLGLLAQADVESYLAGTFPGHALPADFATLVHTRTEGNPLFMADLLRYLRERGVIAETQGRWRLARVVPDLRREMPESIRSMVQRKLDRLGESDRRLLEAAALLGHEFDALVVARALSVPDAQVEERLVSLDRAHGLVRLVREYELPDRALTLRYRFLHVLYQHALQNEIPPSRRAALAMALAQALRQHHGDSPGVAGELACLYELGRDFARAARQFQVAAENAARVFAHQEAVVLARRGLDQVDALPASASRDALEIPLRILLGLQLQVTEGFAAPGAQEAYVRARELGQREPEAPTPFALCWGLWLYHKVRSELGRAFEMAGELQALAARSGESSLLVQAEQALAVTTLCLGRPTQTRRHMEQGNALYDASRHRGLSTQYGQDPGVACKAFGAIALWLLGYPDSARRQAEDARRLSQELGQPSSQALAWHFTAMLEQHRRNPRRVAESAGVCAGISTEQGFSFWLAGSTVMRGWAEAAQGSSAGVAQLRRGLSDWQATGSITYRTYYLGLLAEVLLLHGLLDEARLAVEEGLALATETGEGLHEAELLRLRGLTMADPAQAEECFREALAVARRQQTRSLELRAAMTLAERSGERAVLAEVYEWFREGLDTPDLRDARRILGRASAPDV